MMLCCTCYIAVLLLVWRRRSRRIGAPIPVSWESVSRCGHKTLLVTGTPSSATCGASAANQLMHGFRGSREGSPEWYLLPSRFQIWPTPGARARQHLLGDDGLTTYIVLHISWIEMFRNCFQFQMKLTFCQRQYHWRTISPERLCQCLSP